MEDMHTSLNKTITKLSNMAKTAEEKVSVLYVSFTLASLALDVVSVGFHL